MTLMMHGSSHLTFDKPGADAADKELGAWKKSGSKAATPKKDAALPLRLPFRAASGQEGSAT